MPDFSDAGYLSGRAPIPTVAGVITVQPGNGDDTALIQAAINQVAQLPIGPDGFRGAVELGPGEFQIASQLRIEDSGIVLRGAGQDGGGTVLRATGTTQRSLIEIEGSSSAFDFGTRRNFIDKVVPVGAHSFRLDSTSGFAVGDTIEVERPSTAEWIAALGTDMIPERADGGTVVQWAPGAFNVRYERTITRIEGDRVFIDAPLTNAFEQEFGGGTIRQLNTSGRIENVGIENLRAESDFASATDENHATNFVSIDRAENVFVRDATSAHFVRSSVLANPGSTRVTVDNVTNVDPVSQVTGGRRFTFDLSGQLGLVTNSEANEGRHDFVNNSSRPAGPNVFHNSVARNALDESGAHQRYATGTLFDNITVEGDQINAYNRGNFGTGHGWAGANQVIWNSTAESFIVQNPPTAQNWLIGSVGTILEDDRFGQQELGNIDAHGAPIAEIPSLYEAQLADATDVTTFRASGVDANWNDVLAWRQNVAPGAYTIELRDHLIGDIDDFENDGASSVDAAFIDPAWQAFIESTSSNPVTGFDDTSGDQNVAFTIQHTLDAEETVIHGSLALALTATGGAVNTDFLRLFDTDAEHRFSFSELGFDVGLASGDPFVGVVDLGAFTDELQSGSVNVQLNDDTGVDWAIYTITVANEISGGRAAEVVIDGGGRVTIDTAVNNVDRLLVGGEVSGQLNLAASGSLEVSELYTQLNNGVLEVELSDSGATSLEVDGVAALDGQLRLELDDGFLPTLGEAFTILTADLGIVGQFADVITPELVDGLELITSYDPNSVVVEVLLSGDYNDDGIVNAADFTLFRDTLGSTTNLAADGNNNGVVDAADYDLLVAFFGNSASDFSSIVATAVVVPEPSSWLLLLTLASGTLSLRRR